MRLARSTMPSSVRLVLLIALLAASPAAAGEAPVRYRVAFPAPEHHYAQVEVTFADVPAAPLEVHMSRSSPGRYAVHEFAKNVFDLRAFDGAGLELSPARPSPSRWDVAGHDGTVRIVYKVFGLHVDGTYLAIDASHAHMNMPATLLWARGFEARPARIAFEPPRDSRWKAATQLFSTDDPWTFTAPNFQYLMDSPVELSDHMLRSFQVRGPDGRSQTIRMALHHDGDAAAADEYAAGTEKIAAEAAAVFGEFPAYDTGTYTFLGDYLPWARGDGMEHRNSTVVSSATSFRHPGAVQRVLDTVSHEFFHGWNVERIRPRSLEPFRFDDANISGELWLAEGFTQYYGELILARAGLMPGEEGPGVLAAVPEVVNAPGRRFRSAVEMSRMAPFTDAAAAIDQTNFSNTFISYYRFGAALAAALDLSLRDRSDGRVTLDDFMRAMWREHGRPPGPAPGLVARPYTLEDARARLAEVAGDRRFADDFFNRYIEGREVPDYARLVARAGLRLRKISPGRAWTGLFDGGTAGDPARRWQRAGGADAPDAQGLAISELVAWGSPAFDAGLDQGDVIVRAGSARIGTVEDWTAAVRGRRPGDRLTVEFLRHGAPQRTDIVLGEDPAIEIVTLESAGVDPTPAQRAFRQAWLAPRRK